jgi:hypothetical protein
VTACHHVPSTRLTVPDPRNVQRAVERESTRRRAASIAFVNSSWPDHPPRPLPFLFCPALHASALAKDPKICPPAWRRPCLQTGIPSLLASPMRFTKVQWSASCRSVFPPFHDLPSPQPLRPCWQFPSTPFSIFCIMVQLVNEVRKRRPRRGCAALKCS